MGQPAARVGDNHVCPMVTPGVPPVPHVGGPVLPPGQATVLIGGMPAARMGDMCFCTGPPDAILKGSLGVFIGKKPAARMGDLTTHGGSIVVGLPTVLIGDIYIAALMAIANSVNPLASVINCGFIIDAVVAQLQGTNPGATAPAGRDGSWQNIESRFGTTFAWGQNFNQAFAAVQAGGPGTTAVVGIQYPSGGSHVVIMTNYNGQPAIIEGQDWGGTNGREVITGPDRANQRYGSGSEVGVAIIPAPAPATP